MIRSTAAEVLEQDLESGVRERRVIHPVELTLTNLPLDPISDEDNARIDETLRSTKRWLTHEELLASLGFGQEP